MLELIDDGKAATGASIKVISDAVLNLSQMDGGAVDKAAKNLKGDLSESSGSGSPSPSVDP